MARRRTAPQAMPKERFPRERFAADVAQRLRDSERGGAPAARASSSAASPPPVYGLIAPDAEGRVSFLNPAAAETTGWPADDAVGKPASQVVRIVAPKSATDVLNAALGDGAVYQVEGPVREHSEL